MQVCFYCPNKAAAMVIIVVSLTYTAYLCGALISFCTSVADWIIYSWG